MTEKESKRYVGEKTFDTFCLMLKNREQQSHLMVEAYLKKFKENYIAILLNIVQH